MDFTLIANFLNNEKAIRSSYLFAFTGFLTIFIIHMFIDRAVIHLAVDTIPIEIGTISRMLMKIDQGMVIEMQHREIGKWQHLETLFFHRKFIEFF